MADKKKAAEGGSATETNAADKPVGEKAVVPEPAPRIKLATPRTNPTKVPKLAKSNKSRLPRRQKKAQQKAAARAK